MNWTRRSYTIVQWLYLACALLNFIHFFIVHWSFSVYVYVIFGIFFPFLIKSNRSLKQCKFNLILLTFPDIEKYCLPLFEFKIKPWQGTFMYLCVLSCSKYQCGGCWPHFPGLLSILLCVCRHLRLYIGLHLLYDQCIYHPLHLQF